MGSVLGATMATTISDNTTTYFVKTITLTNSFFSTLDFNVMCDDGFVLYINGKEVTRDNMGTGTIAYTTSASSTISGGDEGDYDTYSALDTFLVTGVNYFAFELHNTGGGGASDLAFDLEVIATHGIVIDSTDMILFRNGAWDYKDDGSNQGTSWIDSGFNSSTWSSGDAVLGYGTLDGATVSTTLSYGADASNKHITTYFRKEVTLTNPDYKVLEISLLADDGAAIYINEKLAMTYGMPSFWGYDTLADYTVGAAEEGDYTTYQVPDTFLVNGVNTFAVEVHQVNITSSDLGFDMEIKGKSGRILSGNIFLDIDGNGVQSSYDVFGSGAIEIKAYNDADSNGVVTDADVISSILTNPYGDYSMLVQKNVRHMIVKMMTEDFDIQVEYTTDTTLAFTIDTTNSDSIEANFGTLGPRSLCLLIADDQSNLDEYYMANRISGKNQYIATMETDEIEALAIRIGMDSMWAFDDGQFGSVNILTGEFIAIGAGVGYGTGLIGGSSAGYSFTDVDGLAYDPINDILYGVERRSGNNDLLITIDRGTGNLINGFFGNAREFLEITGTGIQADVDDIAFDPNTGQLLAVNSVSGTNTRYISINPITAVGTVVSIVGVGDFEGLGYYNTGELYGTTGAVAKTGYPENTIYRINKATGVGTKLDSLYAGAKDTEACDCLTGPLENLISGVVFYDNDSSGTYEKDIDVAYGNYRVYLYRDANSNGHIDAGDYIIDTTYTNPTTGLYVFKTDSLGAFLTTPYIQYTILVTYNTTTDDSLTETANFLMHGDFDGKNDFGFHATAGIAYLPVEWLDIDAQWTGKHDALVTWSTASETNSSHFELERKTDDTVFEFVGRVEAAGNTQSISEYSFADLNAKELHANYIIYRVKQLDFDLKHSYSDNVVLSKKDNLAISAYPNLVKDHVTVTMSKSGQYSLFISDMLGNVVLTKDGYCEPTPQPIRIDGLDKLRAGTYILTVKLNKEVEVVKLIKY
jgi:hypothetical protein